MKKLAALLLVSAFMQLTTHSQSCLPGGLSFISQAEIDDFQTFFPGCNIIEGDVRIGYWAGSNITNLDGLNILTSIGGNLRIEGNPILADLKGLSNLTSVDGSLVISWNDEIASLTGLENLTYVGGGLEIYNNGRLISLKGLENLNVGAIIQLIIANNDVLSSCEVHSICEYLENSSGDDQIFENKNGCNNANEVSTACIYFSGDAMEYWPEFSIYPNPAENHLSIVMTLAKPSELKLEVMNKLGQVVITLMEEYLSQGNYQLTFDVSDLAPGLYFYRLSAEKHSSAGKFVKM
jgi:hypothetical protein